MKFKRSDENWLRKQKHPNREAELGFLYGVPATQDTPLSVYAATNTVCPECNLYRSPHEFSGKPVCSNCRAKTL